MRHNAAVKRTVLAILLASLAAAPAYGASKKDVDSAKGKISSIEEEKKKTEQAIKELETLKADTETYVRKLDSQLETLNAEVNRLEGNIRDKEKTIEETAVKLDEAGKVEKKQYEAMKKRIKYMYEKGDSSYLDLLLQSKSMSELLNRAEYISKISEYDRNMLDQYAAVKDGIADDKAQLDADTETIRSIAGGKNCEMSVLTYQQEDGLNTVLPYGLRKIDTLRTLTTESAAALVPFSSQEIRHKGGIYYGVNATSRNLIVCDRRQLLNSNSFILGVSGSGKSFAAKEEITSIALSTDDDIIIVDPEREYAPLVRALGGEVVQISAGSANHINALDMASGYGEVEGKSENPLILKSQFVMSLCEQLMKPEPVDAKAKSIIGRCVNHVYQEYVRDYQNTPTLKEFREELLRQPEPEAQSIALALELFVDGTLDVFAYQTNVNMNNRIMLFDIFDLGSQLKTVGMLVMLDAILNRVIENHKRGRRTWIYIDEIYLFFANEYSTNFLEESWKRFRKKNAAATGITQNVTDCLRSPTAKNMLANSEFLLMLSQAPTDQQELVNLLHISGEQLGHISNAESGHGLIKVGGALVPFVNQFPRDTELYRLMTTRPGESL